MKAIAMLPSPTAAATRFTGLRRTSPHANTPGMLVSARDLVLRLPQADERLIRVGLSGNLCRCTGYVGVVRAVHSVIEARRV